MAAKFHEEAGVFKLLVSIHFNFSQTSLKTFIIMAFERFFKLTESFRFLSLLQVLIKGSYKEQSMTWTNRYIFGSIESSMAMMSNILSLFSSLAYI